MDIKELFQQVKKEADACFDPAFFAEDRIRHYAARAKLAEDHVYLLLAFLDFVDDALLYFIWQYYYLLFCSEADFSESIGVVEDIPLPDSSEEKFPGCICSLVYLLAVDNLEKWTDGKDVNKTEIIESYFFRYREFAELNTLTHNTFGLCRLAYFMYGYAKPAILRIGRLDFQYTTYRNYCEMYEDTEGNRFFAALPNYTYNQFGLQEPDGFLPVYRKEGSILTAHFFGEKGRLDNLPQKIDLTQLQTVLKPGDHVITIHIPAEGRMMPEDVKESIRKAYVLFGKYMPVCKAIVCQTWFLDPALRGEIIRDGSNMAAFADLFDIICGTDSRNFSIYEHIFKVKPQPLEDLKPANAFQQRIVERALRGERIYWSYGVLKKEFCDALRQNRVF